MREPADRVLMEGVVTDDADPLRGSGTGPREPAGTDVTDPPIEGAATKDRCVLVVGVSWVGGGGHPPSSSSFSSPSSPSPFPPSPSLPVLAGVSMGEGGFGGVDDANTIWFRSESNSCFRASIAALSNREKGESMLGEGEGRGGEGEGVLTL